jgi:hypothetical protein
MADNLTDVNWFRFVVIISLSVLTSLIVGIGDEILSNSEIINAVLQALFAGFAYLQCPADLHKKK